MQKDRFVQNESRGFSKIKEDPELYHPAYQKNKTQLFLEMFTRKNNCGSEKQGYTNIEFVGKVDKFQRVGIIEICK